MNKFFYAFFILVTIGFLDASYLTYEHYMHVIPPCSLHAFLADCGAVLTSRYATVLGIPVALFGAIYYLALLTTGTVIYVQPGKFVSLVLLFVAIVGGMTSFAFIVLQLSILHAICVYCMTSDTISLILLGLVTYMYKTKQFLQTLQTNQ